MKQSFSAPSFIKKAQPALGYFMHLLNTLSPVWVVFILLSGNFLTCIPDGNEETYLQIAKHFYNPGWIPGAFTVSEFAGARLLYECITGFLLNIFSFEAVTFTGKLIICLWYAYIIAGTAKRFAFSNLQIVFILQVVLFTYPWFFSGEYFLPGFEPKHIAYGFILTAINHIFDKRYNTGVLLIIAACWFHILVGGWFFIAFMLYLLWTREASILKIAIYSATCILLLSPLIYFLVKGIIINYKPVQNGLYGNWIYSYVRVPNHTGIFKSIGFFQDTHLKGVLWTLIAMLTSAFVFNAPQQPALKRINRFLFTITALLLFNVVLAYFDKHGSFVKYYPFRLTPISAYLFYLIGFSMLFSSLKESGKVLERFMIISSCILFFYAATLNIYKMIRLAGNEHKAFYDMAAYIKKSTEKNAVIYYADQSEDYRLTFSRVADRDRFFVYKFAPGGTNKIYEWYNRMLIQEKAEKNPAYVLEAKNQYRIDYVLTTDSIGINGYREVQYIAPYRLYQLHE